MEKVEHTKTGFTRLMDMMDACTEIMNSKTRGERSLQQVREAVGKIKALRTRGRREMEEILDTIIEDLKDDLDRMDQRDDFTTSKMYSEIRKFAGQYGLHIMLVPKGSEGADRYQNQQFRISIKDSSLFHETLESMQPSPEDLLRLAEIWRKDILSLDPETFINSKTFEVPAIIADQESVQDDAFLSRVKNIAKAFATDMPNKRIAIELFIEFEKEMGIRLRVIPTGDVNLTYLQEAETFMESWKEKAKWMHQNPDYALYTLKMNALYENALRKYIEMHITKHRQPGFEKAIEFAMDHAYTKKAV